MKRRKFNRISRKRRTGFSFNILIASALLITGITAGFMFVSAYDVNGESRIKDAADPESATLSMTAAERIQQKVTELEIEEIFWKNRVALAETGELYLCIDLIAGYISLDMEGVQLRGCKIESRMLGSSLDELKERGKSKEWLFEPFTLRNEQATLPKQPILVKDITSRPDTSDALFLLKRPVEDQEFMFELEFDRGLRLLAYETGSDPDTVPALFREPENGDRRISLALDRHDVRAIYRALADSAKMILRF